MYIYIYNDFVNTHDMYNMHIFTLRMIQLKTCAPELYATLFGMLNIPMIVLNFINTISEQYCADQL